MRDMPRNDAYADAIARVSALVTTRAEAAAQRHCGKAGADGRICARSTSAADLDCLRQCRLRPLTKTQSAKTLVVKAQAGDSYPIQRSWASRL